MLENVTMRDWDYKRDAAWAAEVTDSNSAPGYCVSLYKDGSMISWKTKKKPTVALSTCEAEDILIATTTKECIFLVQLLEGIDGK